NRQARAGAARARTRSEARRERASTLLAAVEGDGLLLRERRHAVTEILRVAALGDGLGLELHLRLQALLGGLVEKKLGAAEGERRPLGELARERAHRPGELRVRMHAIHESTFHGFLRREHPAVVVALYRASESDEPGKEVG